MRWTTENVETLRRLWAGGWTASRIGAELGFTKNKVIGKAHRMGFKRDNAPAVATSPRVKPAVERRAAPKRPIELPPAAEWLTPIIPPLAEPAAESEPVPEPAPEDIAIPESARVSIMDLQFESCRWPEGDPQSADFGFCGAPRADLYNAFNQYCRSHSAIAFRGKPPARPMSEATKALIRAKALKRGATAWKPA